MICPSRLKRYNMEDIKFIRDDSSEKALQLIDEIRDLLSKNPLEEQNITVRFIRAAIAVSYKEPKQLPEQPVKLYAEQKIKSPRKLLKMPKPIKKKMLFAKKPEIDKKRLGIDMAIETFKRQYPLAIYTDSKGNNLVVIDVRLTDNKVKYIVAEPELDMGIISKLDEFIAKKKDRIKDAEFIEKNTRKICKKLKIEFNEDLLDKVKYYVHRDCAGLWKIDPCIHDSNIMSITCNGANKPVKVSYDAFFELDTNIVFDNEELNKFMALLAERAGKTLTDHLIDANMFNFIVKATPGHDDVDAKFTMRRHV